MTSVANQEYHKIIVNKHIARKSNQPIVFPDPDVPLNAYVAAPFFGCSQSSADALLQGMYNLVFQGQERVAWERVGETSRGSTQSRVLLLFRKKFDYSPFI